VRNTAWLFGARSLSKVLVFVSVVLTQRSLGDDGYGRFATIVVFSNLASIVADAGLQVVFAREAARHRERLGGLLAVILAAKLPLVVLSGLALWGAVALLSPSLLSLVPAVFVLMVVTSFTNLLRSSYFATGEAGFEVASIALETVVLLGVTIVAAALHAGVAVFVTAYTISYGSTLLLALIVTQRRYARIRLSWDPTSLRGLLRSSLPFALAFVLSTVYFKIDVVILQALRGFGQVGSYNAAYKFLEGISFIPAAVMTAIFPALSIIHLRGRAAMRAAYTDAYRLLAAVGMPVAVGTAVLAYPIVDTTRVLPSAAPSLRILGVGILLVFVNNSFIYVLGAMDRQLTFALLAGLSLVVNVVLNLVMIPLFPRDQGYLASSWATVITEVFLFVAGYIALGRSLGRLPWLRPTLPIAVSGALLAAVTIPLRSHAVAAVAAGAVVYVTAMVLSGGVRRAELRMARAVLLRRGSAVRG